jgi:hypothetical protein
MPIKRKNPTPGPDDLQVIGQAFVEADDTAKLFSGRADELKVRLKDFAEKHGDKDDNGHSWITLKTPVVSKTMYRGKVKETVVIGFKREKRSTPYLDPEKAEAWLRERGFYDECVTVTEVRELDETKLWLLVMDKKATDEEVQALYSANVTYALNRVTE